MTAYPRTGFMADRMTTGSSTDGLAFASTLATLIRFPTVSRFDPGEEDPAPFLGLMEALHQLFPAVHRSMERTDIGDRGILFEWRGSTPALEPVILCAHFDVVPAEDPQAWRHPPFAGAIADGFVWGRGAQDIKVTLSASLLAAEALLDEGFTPRRTIFFAFGGDEETGGTRGAGSIAAILASRGLKAFFLLDEGAPVAEGLIAFATRPLALIGIAEKGYMDVLLTATGAGGHASMPPRRSVAGSLCRAVAALEAKPFPPRLVFTVKTFLQMLADASPPLHRLLFRNLRITAPAVLKAFASSPTSDALIRTTMAFTMLSGSPKENVLADRATAIVNMRILPGENSDSTLARVQGIVTKHGVEATKARPEHVVEPSGESPVDHEGWRAIERSVRVSFPEALPVPFLFSAGTDTKHYRRIARAIYRFTPMHQRPEDIAGIHGRDERISLDNLVRCVHFYRNLLSEL